MICAKHKASYVGQCAKCETEAESKEKNLAAALGKSHKTLNWATNPLYDGGRRNSPEFRNKVYSGITFLTKAYGSLLDKRKLADLDNALRGNLDDVFAVAHDDQEWTNVVHALGGKHGDAVYGEGGRYLGTQQSFGCTTYSHIAVQADKSAAQDAYTSMAALIDDSKRIYLHSTKVSLSTVTHEMLHYFCHKSFHNAFAQAGVGAEWRTMNEGVTEYLTRLACTGGNQGCYENEVEKLQILLRAGLTKQEIEAAYFGGQIGPLVEKMKAGELTAESLGADPRMAAALGGAGGRRRGGQAASSSAATSSGATNSDK